VTVRKTPAAIIDDGKEEPRTDNDAHPPADDGDIATPKSQPPTEDDRPLE
jgi:hypothetical protein